MTRPVIDFWYSGTSRLQALKALARLYPRYSPARRLAFLVNASNVLTLRRGPRAAGAIRDLLSSVPVEEEGAAALLLHKVQQNGRVYAFAFDGVGELRTVTKIAFTAAARVGVAREHDVLLKLPRSGLPFQVPDVVSYGDSAAACVLCVSAADPQLRTHDKREELPARVFESIGSLRPPGAPDTLPRRAFSWFEAELERITTPAILAIARGIAAERRFTVCAAHRDLGSENVLSSRDRRTGEVRFAILDWEAFVDTAPAMTDRVAFWLGQHHRCFKRRVGAWSGDVAAARFCQAFDRTPGGVEAAVLALLGLLHIGNDLAQRLCGARR